MKSLNNVDTVHFQSLQVLLTVASYLASSHLTLSMEINVFTRMSNCSFMNSTGLIKPY